MKFLANGVLGYAIISKRGIVSNTVEEKPDAISVDCPVLSIAFDTFNINPKAGETVLVKIKGNATTGFRCQLPVMVLSLLMSTR